MAKDTVNSIALDPKERLFFELDEFYHNTKQKFLSLSLITKKETSPEDKLLKLGFDDSQIGELSRYSRLEDVVNITSSVRSLDANEFVETLRAQAFASSSDINREAVRSNINYSGLDDMISEVSKELGYSNTSKLSRTDMGAIQDNFRERYGFAPQITWDLKADRRCTHAVDEYGTVDRSSKLSDIEGVGYRNHKIGKGKKIALAGLATLILGGALTAPASAAGMPTLGGLDDGQQENYSPQKYTVELEKAGYIGQVTVDSERNDGTQTSQVLVVPHNSDTANPFGIVYEGKGIDDVLQDITLKFLADVYSNDGKKISDAAINLTDHGLQVLNNNDAVIDASELQNILNNIEPIEGSQLRVVKLGVKAMYREQQLASFNTYAIVDNNSDFYYQIGDLRELNMTKTELVDYLKGQLKERDEAIKELSKPEPEAPLPVQPLPVVKEPSKPENNHVYLNLSGGNLNGELDLLFKVWGNDTSRFLVGASVSQDFSSRYSGQILVKDEEVPYIKDSSEILRARSYLMSDYTPLEAGLKAAFEKGKEGSVRFGIFGEGGVHRANMDFDLQKLIESLTHGHTMENRTIELGNESKLGAYFEAGGYFKFPLTKDLDLYISGSATNRPGFLVGKINGREFIGNPAEMYGNQIKGKATAGISLKF